MTLALHPSIDRVAARRRYAADGHVQIMPWLTDDSAAALRAHLIARDDWREVINSGDKVFELDRDNQAKLGPEDRKRLDAAVDAGARSGFQHRYESIRVSDDPAERASSATALDAFAAFMSSDPVLEVLRGVTRLKDVNFVDAQATSYRRGDFLTAHHDEVAGKNRRAAYVLGLTPEWRAEWGGLLLFHDSEGDTRRGLVPRFNCLNLFAVPQEHSVSQVASYAGGDRLSVTGWLRAL
jgi:Rps23 Pro-64 3,4-dihydroxylase Tpa1-like proline 4-hydroxylase